MLSTPQILKALLIVITTVAGDPPPPLSPQAPVAAPAAAAAAPAPLPAGAAPLLPASSPLLPAPVSPPIVPPSSPQLPVADPADPAPAAPELSAARVTGGEEKDEDEELSRLLSQGADEKPEKEPTELEASSVKEAALDDKLGVELRSIVEQIQDMQREVADALKDGG